MEEECFLGIVENSISVTLFFWIIIILPFFRIGEWELNKMHGEGIFFFAYGGVIKGQFYKSKINGAAILKFPNGDVYEGFWRHGKLDGKCFKYFLQDRTWALCIYENGIYRSCLNRGKGTPNISNKNS